jgi:hypothetical protein
MEGNTFSQQRTLEELNFIKRGLNERNELLRQVVRERDQLRHLLLTVQSQPGTGQSGPGSICSKSSEQEVVYTLPDKLPVRASGFVPAVSVYPSVIKTPAVSVMPSFIGVPVCGPQHVQDNQSVVHTNLFQMPVNPGIGSASGMLDARDSANCCIVDVSGPSTDINLDMMPKYDGSKKGLHARFWIRRIEDMRTLYCLNERQLVSVARLLCTGLVHEWTVIQPDDQSWEQFKDAFLNEWGRVNKEKIFIEMLNHHQGKASVGEYAVTMQRYFVQLDITPQWEKDYFVKNLRMGLRESVFASHPETLSAAIESAHEAERMINSLSGNWRDMGQEVQHLGKEVHNCFPCSEPVSLSELLTEDKRKILLQERRFARQEQ